MQGIVSTKFDSFNSHMRTFRKKLIVKICSSFRPGYLVSAFCCAIIAVRAVTIYLNDLKVFPNNYQWRELMINYEGGFIRRGLLGQILYWFDSFIAMPYLAGIIYGLCLLVLLICFAVMLEKLRLPAFLKIMILLSPGLLLFEISQEVMLKKDLITLASLVVISLFASSFVLHRIKNGIFELCFGLIVVVSLLVNEIVMLFLPVIFIYLLPAYRSRHLLTRWLFMAAVLAAVGCMLTVPYVGGADEANRIFASWQTKYPSLTDYTGSAFDPFSFMAMPHENYLGWVRFSLSSNPLRISCVVLFILSVLPSVFIMCMYRTLSALSGRIYQALFCLSALSPLALFAFGMDFGRWIVMGSIVFTFLVLNLQYVANERGTERVICLGRYTAAAAFVAAVFYVVLWQAAHWSVSGQSLLSWSGAGNFVWSIFDGEWLQGQLGVVVYKVNKLF